MLTRRSLLTASWGVLLAFGGAACADTPTPPTGSAGSSAGNAPAAPAAASPAAAPPAAAPPVTSAVAASSPAAATGTPKRGGSFRYIAPLLAGTFDPIYFKTPIELSYAWPAYNALVENDPIEIDKLGPGLADSWTLDDAGTTYTFKLHPGIKFHDGAPFTSADVKYTYEAILKPPAGEISRRKATLAAVTSIDAPDDITVVIKTQYPTASLLPGIASIPILPKHVHEQGPFVDKALGTGPFKFVSYQKDIELVFRRNEDYWRPGYPYLDEVHAIFLTDAAASLQAMRTGRADQFSPLGEAEETALRQNNADTIVITTYPRLNVGVLDFNHTLKDKPWTDKRVRQAVSLAIDRQDYINTVWGGRGDIIGMVPNVGGWALPPDELAKYAGYSGDKASKLARAKQLMADAGVPDGFKVTAVASTGYLGDMALFAQAALKPIGIDVSLISVDQPTVGKKRTDGDFEMLFDTIPTSVDDPDELLSLFVTGETLNYSRYSNPQVDDLYKQQARTVDPAKRKELVYQIQRILLDDMLVVMLQGRVDAGATAKFVKNFMYIPSQHFHFAKALERVWLDK